VLVATGADGFDLELDDGSRDHIAYADVVQARTVFEWVSEGAGGARSSKPGHRSGRAKDRAKDRAKERTRT
jgi:hypothetical protein